MLKVIRKHNKWLMVGFGILLMVAWSSGPILERLGRASGNRTVATLDGQKISGLDQARASQEMMALERFVPTLLRNLGIAQSDSTHWLLLTHEARQAGLIGGTADGREFLSELARFTVDTELRRNFQLMMQLSQNPEERTQQIEEMVERVEAAAPSSFGEARLNEPQMYETLANLRGITRLIIMHNRAARFSDRHAIIEAKELQDSAVVDALFIPAADRIEQIPDPSPEQLAAHFEQFASTPAGEGEFGIGYFLPERLKLEWLKLDRAAMEQAIRLDPVEVSKRYMQNRASYTGEFADERQRVETDMRADAVTQAMQAAHGAIQASVLSATRRLDQEGRFRRIPENWEEQRPRMEDIALNVVQAVARNNGPSIPVPQVQVRADRWHTQEEIRGLEGIGQSFLRRGQNTFPADQVLFAAREFQGPDTPLPVQAGIPQVEYFLTDWTGNRYYYTILATREASPPDSVDEIRDQAVRDFKTLEAFRQLAQRAQELRAIAVNQGLAGAVSAVALPGRPAPEIKNDVRVFRDRVDGNDPAFGDEDVRAAIMAAAAKVDPLATPEQLSPVETTVAVPSKQPPGLMIARVQSKTPLSTEDYRLTEQTVLQMVQQRELQEEAERQAEEGEGAERTPAPPPFSLEALLRRHTYVIDDKRALTPEDLRRSDDPEFAPEG